MISDDGLIALLLNESGIVRRISAQATFNQQIMQFTQSGQSDSRLTKTRYCGQTMANKYYYPT